jgi:hypothetical protein
LALNLDLKLLLLVLQLVVLPDISVVALLLTN